MDYQQFIRWEARSRDVIDLKRCYIDVAEDLVAGVLLSQIVYWFLPDKNGNTKLKVFRDGFYWLAKERKDWWQECRVTPTQFDRAANLLESRQVIVTANFRFNGNKTKHIRIDWDRLIDLLDELPDSPNEWFKSSPPELADGEIHDSPTSLSANSGVHETLIPVFTKPEVRCSRNMNSIYISKDYIQRLETESTFIERTSPSQSALSEQEENPRVSGNQSASLLKKQKSLADDGETSSETVSSAAPFFPPQKNNATANFERRFVSPHKYPELVEAGHGDIMIGTGRLDFDSTLVEAAVLHLKKCNLPCEVLDAKRFILNRILDSNWGSIELLKEAAAALASSREKTAAAIAASANPEEPYDTTRYYIPEPPVVDLEARRKAAEKGIAIMRAARAEAEKKLAS